MKVDQDRDAEFSAFVDASYRPLRRVAFLMVGDWHLAEDVLQVALASLYNNWSRVERSYGPGPYARRTVINAALSELRRSRRREIPVHALPDERGHVDTYNHGLDEPVVKALQALTPRQRAVVVLRYAEDVDVRRTADLLGLPEGTVRSLAARGLATLRTHLALADRKPSATDSQADKVAGFDHPINSGGHRAS